MSRPPDPAVRARRPGPHVTTVCPRGHKKEYVDPAGRLGCQICITDRKRRRDEAKRQERLRERRRRLAERPKPPKTERLWAAGHFEGEGTLTIVSSGQLPTPQVSLTSTDISVIEFFHARWPGSVYSFVPNSSTERSREAFRWQLRAGDAIEAFVLDILPHLQTQRVREKANLLLEEVRERAERRHTDAVRARRYARMSKMRALNKRGIDRPREEGKAGPARTERGSDR